MNEFNNLKEKAAREKKIINEIDSLFQHLQSTDNIREKNSVSKQINSLKNSLKKTNEESIKEINKITLNRPLSPAPVIIKKEAAKQEPVRISRNYKLEGELSELERGTLKRIRKGGKKLAKKEEKKPSKYIEISNRLFSAKSKNLLKTKNFQSIQKDLQKTNLRFTPSSYVSVMFLSTIISFIAGFFIFLFLLFFDISAFPVIGIAGGNLGLRALKVVGVWFALPLATFVFMYLYPSIEMKSLGNKINQELPFATIHMATIAGSMVEPSNIFAIIIATKEYPYLEKEFTKLINEINVYGLDLVSALRATAGNTASKKLADLLNSLATTINSGGDLVDFFEKRSQNFLFEYRLEREKYIKTAETFMDIYISVVIAAPMILMLLLMMMKIGGLGISLSSSMIALIMVLAVAGINIVFLSFLQLKQPGE